MLVLYNKVTIVIHKIKKNKKNELQNLSLISLEFMIYMLQEKNNYHSAIAAL